MRFPSPNDDLSRVWRLLIVRAAIVLVLGVAALPWPVVSVGVMLMLVSGIAVAAGIFDAAMSGALQRHMGSSWALLPEAVVGIVLGGAVLIYPLFPLSAIGALITVWIISRGIMLAAMARGAAADAVLRVVTVGWARARIHDRPLGRGIHLFHRQAARSLCARVERARAGCWAPPPTARPGTGTRRSSSSGHWGATIRRAA